MSAHHPDQAVQRLSFPDVVYKLDSTSQYEAVNAGGSNTRHCEISLFAETKILSEHALVMESLTKIGKIGLGIFLAGAAFFVVGFSVPYWATYSDNRFGLWEACNSAGDSTRCVSALGTQFYVFPDLPGWFRGTQACACFALLCIIAAAVCLILFIFCSLRPFLVASVILKVVAVTFAFVGAGVFGSNIKIYYNISLSWGFAFDIIGGIILLGSVVCFTFEFFRRL